MARAFWKGHLSFGLVEIPVTLKSAISRAEEIHFSLLDSKDFSAVGYRRYNKESGAEVPWERIVRGYEYEPDEFVVLSPQELEAANVEATRTIELLEFVDGAEIDPMYFDEPYWVEPQKQASKSYALLRETLERTGKVGIAQVVLRTRQHLAALRVAESALMLVLLRYAHELVPAREQSVPEGGPAKLGLSAKELAIAEKLVEGMAGRWEPGKYHDTYRDDVLALVQRKIESGQTREVLEPAAPRKRAKEVVDLMPLLQRSLEERAGKRRESPAAARPGRNGRARPRAAGARAARSAVPARRKPARARTTSRTARRWSA